MGFGVGRLVRLETTIALSVPRIDGGRRLRTERNNVAEPVF